jgi:O-antigen/teichoic acid export membrane protein
LFKLPNLKQRIFRFAQQYLQPLRQSGSFARNFALTLSGSAAVTVLGFLLTPVMVRLYAPAAYGQFAVFTSVVSTLSTVTMLSYPAALLLPEAPGQFRALMQLAVVLACGGALLVLVGVALSGSWLLRLLPPAAGTGRVLYALPLLLLLANLNIILSGWYVRAKQFGPRSSIEVAAALGGRGVTLGWGWWQGGSIGGLLLGEVINRLATTVSLTLGPLRGELRSLWQGFSWKQVRAVAREYAEFPLYVLPSGLISLLSTQLPIYLLSLGFGATSVGLYAFSVGLLEIPVSLLGGAVLSVFWQKANEIQQQDPERLPALTLRLYYQLLYLGLLPFGVITVFGDVIFKFAFGARWELAGVYTGYLGYYYVFKLMSQATSPIYNVIGQQRYLLLSNACLLLVRAAALGLGLWHHNLNLALLLFGVGSLATTFLTDLHILSLLALPVGRIAAHSLLLLATALAVLLAGRWGLQQVFPAFVGHSILRFLRF